MGSGEAVGTGCNWSHRRCTNESEYDVWTVATGQVVTRRVCSDHVAVALAVSYREGLPPARLAP